MAGYQNDVRSMIRLNLVMDLDKAEILFGKKFKKKLFG